MFEAWCESEWVSNEASRTGPVPGCGPPWPSTLLRTEALHLREHVFQLRNQWSVRPIFKAGGKNGRDVKELRDVSQGKDVVFEIVRREITDQGQQPGLMVDHQQPEIPDDLANLPSLDFEPSDGKHIWCLDGPDEASAQVRHSPRLVPDDVFTLRQAALEGLGVVRMPLIVGGRDLVEGRLIDVLPGWKPRGGVLHAVFPSRRGLMPAVRALLDFLGESMEDVDWAMAQE